MPFAFQKMQLEAGSLFALISTWTEMQLIVSEDAATIIGYGYSDEIAGAFSVLVFDWEATVLIPKEELDIPPGSYDLIRDKETLYACKEQQAYPLADRPVRVEVVSVPEE
ncbi:MAG: hypothetical protein KBG02_06965 [Haliscomenobacter sp.]|jgi:hypothetical protein|nr:hypothetical protein [Haliscomenobacter sp.]MBP9076587.1 hypothetical protein [Haliscomenobacter sp.]